MAHTYLHPCKCMNCSLHFIACSNYEVWPPTEADDETMNFDPVCPECASDVLMRWAPKETDEFIFQIVPGQQPLVSMGPVAPRPRVAKKS